jgi:hypothetical protein
VNNAGPVFFPLDQQLELWDKHWSEGLVKEAVWLSGVMGSFEQAEEAFARIGHVTMSDNTIWQRAKKWGERFQELEKQQQAAANQLARLGEVGPAKSKSAVRMGVGMDGASIYIRQEGWKELKVGCVFDIELRPIFDPDMREWLEQGHAVNNSYVAHLGGPEQFGQQLWAAAQQRGWEQHYDTQAIGDGAPWIWNLVNLHFYDSQQTIDYYHATEHLSTAASLLYPAKPEAAERWLNRMETQLFQGHAAHIAASLAQAAGGSTQRHKDLRTEADYFCKHQRRMQYLEFREDGYPIGSGMVESEAKQFKARFCGPGMRWSREGAERLIPVRAAIMSHQFDTLWPSVYNSPPN